MNSSGQVGSILSPILVAQVVQRFSQWSAPLYVTGALFLLGALYVVFFVTIAFTGLFPDVVLWLPKQLLPQSVGCFPNPSGSGFICPK